MAVEEKTVVIRDFDEIFRYIGQAGLFQILVYVLLGLPSYFSGYQNIAMTFLAPDVEHWCEVERLTSFPHDQQKYVGEARAALHLEMLSAAKRSTSSPTPNDEAKSFFAVCIPWVCSTTLNMPICSKPT